jgi:FMN phosphatase YigB (HAD superfamily)
MASASEIGPRPRWIFTVMGSSAGNALPVIVRYAPALKWRLMTRLLELGLVTNTWSRKSKYVAELKRAEVFTLFDVLVFSSDGCTVKPSPDLFQRAVVGLGVEKSETLVIGDSLRCDIGGALAAGLRSIWIDPTNLGPPSIGLQPHAWIRSLRELVFHYRC